MNPASSIEKNIINLARLNHHLADEVSKLPEIRNFRNHSSHMALINLIRIYQYAPDKFDRMFEAMNDIGIPEIRKFCSPLQALFWLLQDEKISVSGIFLGLKLERRTDEKGNCIPRVISELKLTSGQDDSTGFEQNYTLDKILRAAWNDESMLMQGSNIHQIITRILTKSDAEDYAFLENRHDDVDLQNYIMDDFLRKPNIFDCSDWQQIKNAINQSRWKTFFTVADRLNSPELVSYYINNKLSFRKTQSNGVYFTFFEKKAQCTDAAYFAQFMLKRAGYETFMRSVKWDNDPWDGLHTGSGIILEDGRYLLVSNYTGINSISGPYSNIESLDQKLSCGRNVIESKWGAYYPPRCY